jgi:hypothetical protein
MPLTRKIALRSAGTGFIGSLLLLWCSLGGCCSVDRPTGSDFVPAGENGGGTAVDLKDNEIDLESRTLPVIPTGTVVGKTAPEGWTHLILFATPTLTKEALAVSPKSAADYARLLKFTLLARTKKVGTTYRLDRLARGFAVNIDGKETVIDSKKTMGARLGLFGNRVLTENEKHFEANVRQVARTPTMVLFDAQPLMRQGTEHVKMVNRHAILVDPATGKVSTFVWLLSKSDAGYDFADKAMQLLPENMQEARMLSVQRDKFVLGIPSADAFALWRIPQGKAIAYGPNLRKVAALKDLKREDVTTLEKILLAAASAAEKPVPKGPG